MTDTATRTFTSWRITILVSLTIGPLVGCAASDDPARAPLLGSTVNDEGRALDGGEAMSPDRDAAAGSDAADPGFDGPCFGIEPFAAEPDASTSTADAFLADPACRGPLANFTRSSLAAASDPARACVNPIDLDIVCGVDVLRRSLSCGRDTCVDELRSPEPTRFTQCVSICLSDTSLSTPCLSCYAELSRCTTASCLGECRYPDYYPGRCEQCQVAAGCFRAFDQCSGLGVGATAPDGGAEAGPPSSGAATDAPSDSGT